MFARHATYLFSFATIAACGGERAHSAEPLWTDASYEYLDGEDIRFLKPARLQRSSRYFLERDLPWLADDSAKLATVQLSLQLMEFADEEIDVFVDSASADRIIVMLTGSPIAFSARDAALFEVELERESERLAGLDTTVIRGPIHGEAKSNGDLKIAKFSQAFTSAVGGGAWSRSLYLVSGQRFTLMVTEVAADEGLIEPYLWSMRSP